jgi:uncharacterized repeat protein (TIGR04044 family)
VNGCTGHAHLHRAIAPGWCDRHGKPRFYWLRQLYASFRPKKFSGRLTNDRLFDWKVIAWEAAINGTAVALVSAAQTSCGAVYHATFPFTQTPLESAMPAVNKPLHQKGDYLVDYEEKVFEDVKAEPGEKALVTFHTVAFEGSIGFVNLLQATRLQRKGFETSVLLYGPGVTLGLQRGFPTLGDEAFPGHLNFNKQLTKFMEEGGKVYACRFALQALYGHGEASLIEGIRPISPLDVLDIQLLHRKDNALVIHTWTV